MAFRRIIPVNDMTPNGNEVKLPRNPPDFRLSAPPRLSPSILRSRRIKRHDVTAKTAEEEPQHAVHSTAGHAAARQRAQGNIRPESCRRPAHIPPSGGRTSRARRRVAGWARPAPPARSRIPGDRHRHPYPPHPARPKHRTAVTLPACRPRPAVQRKASRPLPRCKPPRFVGSASLTIRLPSYSLSTHSSEKGTRASSTNRGTDSGG